MKTRVARIAGIAVVLIVGVLQVIPVDRTNPPVVADVDAPPEVDSILRRACYDCHSHETRWPWYSRVAPVSWFVASHVKRARGDLNLSAWPTFDFELQALAARDIHEQISKKEMPLRSYTWLHRDARLSPEDRDRLLEWANGFR